MSKTTITKFRCDNLGCENEITDNKFPYEPGWQYIYNFEAKLLTDVLVGKGDVATEVRTIKVQDKHFCSQKCTINFLTNITRQGQ